MLTLGTVCEVKAANPLPVAGVIVKVGFCGCNCATVGAVKLNVNLQAPPAGMLAPLTAKAPEAFATNPAPQADTRLPVLKPAGIFSVNCAIAAALPGLLSLSVEVVVEFPVPAFTESDVDLVVQFAV